MQIVGVSLMAAGVFGILVFAAHLAWQQVQRLAYLHRLDSWGEPARQVSDDEWSEEIPEWRQAEPSANACALCRGTGYYLKRPGQLNEERVACPYLHSRTPWH